MTAKGVKWSPYKKLRRTLLKFFVAEYNKAKQEAIFPADKERVETLGLAVEFMNRLDYYPYQYKCPMCGSKKYLKAKIPPFIMKDKWEKYSEEVDSIRICHCTDCGWFNIEGW